MQNVCHVYRYDHVVFQSRLRLQGFKVPRYLNHAAKATAKAGSTLSQSAICLLFVFYLLFPHPLHSLISFHSAPSHAFSLFKVLNIFSVHAQSVAQRHSASTDWSISLDLALSLCYSTTVVIMPSRCAGDNCTSTAPQMCNKCKVTSYCSRACQKAHWRQHRLNCRAGVFPFLQLPREIRDKVSDSGCRFTVTSISSNRIPTALSPGFFRTCALLECTILSSR